MKLRTYLPIDIVKMLRWLTYNTPLSGKEISGYIRSYYDVKVCHETVAHIKKNTAYSDIEGEINIDCDELQRYIKLCYPDTAMKATIHYTIGNGIFTSEAYKKDGPITGARLRMYQKAKINGLI